MQLLSEKFFDKWSRKWQRKQWLLCNLEWS